MEPQRAMVDFSSSEQGRPTVTQLTGDGEIFANAIEFTTWSADPVQVEVCSECGVERCAPGGWVALRRSGDRVIWLPAFDEMAEDDAEFGPPRYFEERGVPIFEPEPAKALAEAVGVTLDEVRPLESRDVAHLLQWAAPGQILGVAPAAPQVRREDVLAATSGDCDDALKHLDELLAAAIASETGVMLEEPPDGAEPISFFLDLPGHPEWTPLIRTDSRLELSVERFIARRSE